MHACIEKHLMTKWHIDVDDKTKRMFLNTACFITESIISALSEAGKQKETRYIA